MKQLASYSFEAPIIGDLSSTLATKTFQQIDHWLGSKGSIIEDGKSIDLGDGRVGTIDRTELNSSHGRLFELTLTEPRPDGWFRTEIKVAESESTIAISVGLNAATSSISPVFVDVRCPRIVRDILSPPSPWQYRGTKLTSSPIDYFGEDGGDRFIAQTWDAARSVPTIAVSDENGSVLHPGIVEAIASDLAGLAIVVRLDPSASWRLSSRKGKEWSCYGGAIRLYWPGIADNTSPFRHPLWTSTRLLTAVSDTEAAADRIRRQLRRLVLAQSAFAISDPLLFLNIRRSAREEELATLRAKATEDVDYKALAEEYFNAATKAHEEIEKRDSQIEELLGKIRGLQSALQSKMESLEDVEPATEAPPSTVEEAILIAMEGLDNQLVFGNSVSDGIETLAKDAGPPEKILNYLRILSDFTRFRNIGSLGTTTIMWLQEKGVIASSESQTVLNSPKENLARTWDYGDGTKHTFNLHLKPADATAPDRCVRIYFDYDESRRKTIIGWVGRHP